MLAHKFLVGLNIVTANMIIVTANMITVLETF